MLSPLIDELVDLYIRTRVSKLRIASFFCAVYELRITFMFLSNWKARTKEEFYSVPCGNYTEFKFQHP